MNFTEGTFIFCSDFYSVSLKRDSFCKRQQNKQSMKRSSEPTYPHEKLSTANLSVSNIYNEGSLCLRRPVFKHIHVPVQTACCVVVNKVCAET